METEDALSLSCTTRTELGAKSPDLSNDKGNCYWDEFKLSFDSFISRVDMRFAMKQLMFSTFCPFVEGQ